MSVRSGARYFSIFMTLWLAASPSTFLRASAGFITARVHITLFVGPTAYPKVPLRLLMSNNYPDKISAPTENPPRTQHSELEVEKKFRVPDNPVEFNNLKETLSSVGFQVTHEEEFVDWYFDLPGPNWHFTLNNIWIRYREKKWKIDKNNWGWKGSWQVKRGDTTVDGGATRDRGGMTIFREYHGVTARDMILEMLSSLDRDKISQGLADATVTVPSLKFYNGHDIPHLDGAEELVPFSIFKTFRTCWKIPPCDKGNKFSALKVDIDRTDFEFAVGEVEAVFPLGCNDTATVESGKGHIRDLVELLTSGQNKSLVEDEKGSSSRAMPMGKLECYLKNNNKCLYEACCRAGVM
ncbi:hypothetical protein HJC23_012054 [Cyclotella cryptica]|uniref:CYTH domain-containing protein n=1 Tax=Cyclotella cryptica TaxID=29204 RepID=A0ABD3NWF5_9STRA